MTTFVPFIAPPSGSFSFQAELDNAAFTLRVSWNVFGQRWYLTCAGGNNVTIFHRALVGSPQEGDLNLLFGYFVVSTLVFREHTQSFEITP